MAQPPKRAQPGETERPPEWHRAVTNLIHGMGAITAKDLLDTMQGLGHEVDAEELDRYLAQQIARGRVKIVRAEDGKSIYQPQA